MRGRKPAVDVAMHPLPRESVLLAAAPERAAPEPPDYLTEDAERPAIQRHAIVPNVPGHDRPQIGALLRDGVMHASPEFGLHFLGAWRACAFASSVEAR